MHCFILAGGFATRLWPLTEKRAKPLLPLAGKPIITHLLENIPGNIPITVSTNAIFRESFQEWQKGIPRSSLTIAIEETTHDEEKLGTNRALAQWIEKRGIDEDVLLITGDNYCGFSLRTFLEAATPGSSLLATYDIHKKEHAKAFGTIVPHPEGKKIRAFEEKPTEPKSTLISTGVSLLRRETLPLIREYAQRRPDYVGGIFEELLRHGKPVEHFTFTEPWFDIGSFDSYLEATRSLVGSRVLLGSRATVKDTHCEGSVVIGSDSHVFKSTLKDVVVFEGCTIENCVLQDCIIDNACQLMGVDLTGKMLREGTVLTRH